MANEEDTTNKSVDNAIAKLCRFVKARFNVDLNYVSLLDIPASDRKRLHAEFMVSADSEEQKQFPVYHKSNLVGYAEVAGSASDVSEIARELTDLIELFLESTVGLADQLQTLNRLEGQLLSTNQARENKNVIPLHRPGKAGAGIQWQIRPRAGFALPALITGINEREISQLAKEIHDLSGRYAFISDADMHWNNLSDLRDLGPVTIFINDVTKLSGDQQKLLTEYLWTQPGTEDPQLIIGALQTYTGLIDNKAVSNDLLRQLSGCLLNMDRPFQEYRRQGVLEFFFDQQPAEMPSHELN